MPRYFENLVPYFEKYNDPDSVVIRGVNSIIELAFQLNLPIVVSKFSKLDLCGHYCKAISPTMLLFVSKLSDKGSCVLENLMPHQLVNGLLTKNPYGKIGIVRGEFAVLRFNRDRDVRILISSSKSNDNIEFVSNDICFGDLAFSSPSSSDKNNSLLTSALPELHSHVDTSFTPVSRGNTPGRLGEKTVKELTL